MKKFLFAFLIVGVCCFAEKAKPFRILAFDGGGVRGAYTAQLLAMVEEETGFLKKVDCFAGTSTGSIIAYGLAYGLKPKEIVDLYLLHADKIFEPYSEDESLAITFLPKYTNTQFKKALQAVIPKEVTLGDLKKKVIATSFQLHNPDQNCWKPICFDNFVLNESSKLSIVDAVLRGSAVPILFPSYQGYVDGAVVSNNPSMVALSRSIDQKGGNKDLKNIFMISFGTGRNHHFISDDVKWGVTEWVLDPSPLYPLPPNPLIALVMDGTSAMVHEQCSQILGKRYLRIDPFLEKNIVLDDWKSVGELVEEAKKLPETDPEAWEDLLDWVRKNF
ncbi:MAG: patatin-like phospholipase family protein [Chlamydiota bacterium]